MRKFIWYTIKTLGHIVRFDFWINRSLRKKEKNKISEVLIYNQFRDFIIKENRYLHYDITVTGKENIPSDSSYLIVSNHLALVDPMIYTETFVDPITFVGKVQIKNYPIIRKLIPLINGKFLDRDNLRQEIKVMKEIQLSMEKDNLRYLLFPEGTRCKDKDFKMLDFKPGTFKYPMQIGKKIVPCALMGTQNVLDDKIKMKKYKIDLVILKPLTLEDYKDKSTQEVSLLVHDMIQKEVFRLRDEHRKVEGEKNPYEKKN